MGRSTFKIFHVLGLIIITLFLAVGLLYTLRGNIYLTGILAILPAIAYVFLIPVLEQKKQENDSAKTAELSILAICTTIAIATFFFFFHGINTEFNKKDAIKKAAYDKFEKTEQLFKDYASETANRLNSFKSNVESRLAAYELNASADKKSNLEKLLGAGTISFEKPKSEIRKQVAQAIAAKQKVMEHGFDLEGTIKKWEEYRKRIQPIVDNWNRLNISFVYYDIDNMYKKVYDSASEKMKDFKYPATLQGEDIALDKPLSALAQSSVLSVFLLLLFYAVVQIFVLMPYLMAKRPAKKNWARDASKENNYTGEIKL